jgi:hypothetical protein
MKKQSFDDRVCQYNFAVTTPYAIQKGASLSSFTDDISILKNFMAMGNKELLQGITFNPLASKSTTDIYTLLQPFVDRYSKQATQTVVDANNFFQSLKKVPGQEIYITDKNFVFEQVRNINNGKPTVLIARGDVTIRIIGSLAANIMVLAPQGTITFENVDCDTNDTVQGIYIAQNFTSNTIKNTAGQGKWCMAGGLVIEGMLIGGGETGIQDLRDTRRSTLNDWFNASTKRDIQIFDGAALRIQTNTKLWDNLPGLVTEVLQTLTIQK